MEGPVTSLRLPATLASKIDQWAKRHGAKSRSGAIRQLLERALASAPIRARDKESIAKAASLARQEMDRVPIDERAPAEEQERRKRRLLKGPKEFREMRNDVGRQRAKAN